MRCPTTVPTHVSRWTQGPRPRHTGLGGVLGRRPTDAPDAARCLRAALAVACATLATSAMADALPAARVVWARDHRAYVATRDSSSVVAGDSVTFLQRGKPFATGTVSRVEHGEMAIVTLVSGSLEDA